MCISMRCPSVPVTVPTGTQRQRRPRQVPPVPWCPALPPAVCPTSPVTVTGQGRAGGIPGAVRIPREHVSLLGTRGHAKGRAAVWLFSAAFARQSGCFCGKGW